MNETSEIIVLWHETTHGALTNTEREQIEVKIHDFIATHDLPETMFAGIRLCPGVYFDLDDDIGWSFFDVRFFDSGHDEIFLMSGNYLYVVMYEPEAQLVMRKTEYKCSCN